MTLSPTPASSPSRRLWLWLALAFVVGAALMAALWILRPGKTHPLPEEPQTSPRTVAAPPPARS